MRSIERILLVWSLAAPAACTETIELEAPVIGSETLIWIAERDGQVEEVYAYEKEHTEILPFRPGDRITLITYEKTLDELALQRGKIPPESGPNRRSLPDSTNIYEGELAPGVVLAPVDAPSAAVLAFKYKTIGPKECIEKFGCYSDAKTDLSGARVCELPCLQPIPDLMPPFPPNPLSTDGKACPAPWAKRTFGAYEFCAPVETICADPRGISLPGGTCIYFNDQSDECPTTDEYHATAPIDARFVRAGAMAGGTGTRTQPFATIDQALAGPPVGAFVIALAAGVYDGPMNVLDGEIIIVGACPASTEVRAFDASGPAFRITGGLLKIQHLRVEGGAIGFHNDINGELELEDVDIQSPTESGVIGQGKTKLTRVRVQNAGTTAIQLSSSTADLMYSLYQVVVDNPGQDGIFLSGTGSHLDVRDSKLSAANLGESRGLQVEGPHMVTVNQVSIERFWRGVSLHDGAGANTVQLAITDVASSGVYIGRTASAEIYDAIIERAGAKGVIAEGAVYPLERTTIIDTVREALHVDNGVNARVVDLTLVRPGVPYAIITSSAAMLSIEGARILEPENGALTVRGASRASLIDVTISGPEQAITTGSAPLLYCGDESTVIHAERILLMNSRDSGVQAGSQCRLTMTDVQIVHANGHGFELNEETRAMIERLLIDGSFESDFSASETASAFMTHVRFRGRHPLSEGFNNETLILEGGSTLELSSFVLDLGKPTGFDVGSSVTLSLKNGEILDKGVPLAISAARELELPQILDEVVINHGMIELR